MTPGFLRAKRENTFYTMNLRTGAGEREGMEEGEREMGREGERRREWEKREREGWRARKRGRGKERGD